MLTGEVDAGQEWRTAIGEGWVFRVLPIDAGKKASGTAGYSGWDLVVDREQPAGFPDALLLATPPYNSINEREVGTTFGLRAQDAIGWNPRSFRFLTEPAGSDSARQLFLAMNSQGQGAAAVDKVAMGKLMQLTRESATGQFRILDARLDARGLRMRRHLPRTGPFGNDRLRTHSSLERAAVPRHWGGLAG